MTLYQFAVLIGFPFLFFGLVKTIKLALAPRQLQCEHCSGRMRKREQMVARGSTYAGMTGRDPHCLVQGNSADAPEIEVQAYECERCSKRRYKPIG